MKPSDPYGRHARERAGRRVVGSDQQQVQQVVRRHLIAGAQVGRRGAIDVASLHGDGHVERRARLEEHQRGHDLGDAGDRALFLRVRLPEHLLGLRVVDDGGGGANVRHFLSGVVDGEARRLDFAKVTRPGRGAGRCDADATRARRALATLAEYERLVAVALAGRFCWSESGGRTSRAGRDAVDEEAAEAGVVGPIRASATMSAGTNRTLLRKAANVINIASRARKGAAPEKELLA